ncbi:haloacid dehalogenase type II [Staphylococcus caeli]|uniref:2-haloalkanoic acid dehalogenase n=1 Tax=Staphylococcus caeli TaxID=2201815 RepID=A0A1D4J365_9STAP|nr:haloacid dehalogenase type II [Staphylococcus caeli]SCS37955.1 2-haloalkanoic acid dehalogenase [Staphylococcus caeli]SCS56153.1 2-haloalkanoic acid dehalogenase [Staphylococcus caeli]
MYKAIIFDMYGTIFDMRSLTNGLDQFEEQQADSIANLWRQTQLNHMFLKQIMQCYVPFEDLTKDALRYALDEHEVQYNDEDIHQLFEAFLNLQYFRELPRVFSDIKAKNIDIGVLSNANDSMLMPLVDHSEIGGYIDTVMSVNEVKQYKPSYASYALILKYYQLKRDEILFVSANSWDVTGAASFGFDTVWINRQHSNFDFNGQTPTITVNSLNELVKWLEMQYK